jgi:AcrR family transcriptional regulator
MHGKRQTVVDTAERLFYNEGFHAVGIDRIIAEAGVAKMTLYKHFPSKADLIVAVLKARDARWQESLRSFVNGFDDPQEKIKAIFMWHDRWFNEADFNGCLFINAAIEYSNAEDVIHLSSRHHKQIILAQIIVILEKMMEKKTAKKLAEQLLQVLEGAIITGHIFKDRNAALTAWRTAATILQTARADQR